MKFEDFVRGSLSDRKISVKDAAAMLGYTEPSFRNKLSKGNLNLRDILILGILFDMHLSLYDDFESSAYSFDIRDYLTDEDLTRLKTFMDSSMNDQKYLEWFKGLPNEMKETIFNMVQSDKLAPQTDKGKKKLVKSYPSKDGFSLYQGLRMRYFIFGSDHDKAYYYIMQKKTECKRMTEKKENEIIENAIKQYDIEIKSDIAPV